MRLFQRRSPMKAVFNLKVDFKREYKEKLGELEKGNSYYLPRQSNRDKETSYDEIKNFIVDSLEDDLKKHLAKTVGVQIRDIRVTNDYQGSIELVFVVLFNTYQFIAGLKDFYDNLRLIRNYSEKHIKHRLNDKYGAAFEVNTSIDYPTIDRHEDLFWMFHKSEMPFPFQSSEHSKRDGLFYYLLISNIALLAITSSLVFKAVRTYYGF